MGTRGRASVAQIETRGAVTLVNRPDAPLDLTPEETAEWVEIAEAMPADWFTRETHGLLKQYCRHIIAARRVAQLIDQEMAAAGVERPDLVIGWWAVPTILEHGSPEQIEQRIKKEVQDALAKSGVEVKMREVAAKERKTDAEVEKLMREAVQIGVQAAYSAMQGGAQIAAMPQIAPIADAIMQGAGYQLPKPGGVDPNFPQPVGQADAAPALPPAQQNTSPAYPPVPQSGMQGIETPATNDNIEVLPQ